MAHGSMAISNCVHIAFLVIKADLDNKAILIDLVGVVYLHSLSCSIGVSLLDYFRLFTLEVALRPVSPLIVDGPATIVPVFICQ